MEMNYCRRCGASLTKQLTHMYSCSNNHHIYVNPACAVGVFLLNERDEVAVAIRAENPGAGTFDAPGGFVDDGETLEHAITRELREETGLESDQYSTPQYLCSGFDKYEFAHEYISVTGSMFWARLVPGVPLAPHDDVAEIRFIPLAKLAPETFFFSGVQDGVRALIKTLS